MGEVVDEQQQAGDFNGVESETNVPKNPWGRVKVNWAEDVENAEREGELKVIEPLSAIQIQDQIQDQKLTRIGNDEEDDEDYPSLEKSKTRKGGKKKGGKNQKVSLQAFQAQGLNDNFNAQAIRMSLPSHSRERAPGEEDDRRRPFRDDGYHDGRRGGRGGFDRDDGGFHRGGDRRGGRPPREDNYEPSQADTVDNWGSTNKFAPSQRGGRQGGFGDYRESKPRRGGFGDSYRPSEFQYSEADTKDNWQSERPPPRNDYASQYQPPRRGGSDSGYGVFSDGRGPPAPRRSAGFVADSRADFEDKWTIGGKYSQAPEPQGPFSSIKSDSRRRFDNRVGYSDTDRWSRNADPYSDTYTPPPPMQTPGAYVPPSQRKDPFGGARPREEVNQHAEHNITENGVQQHAQE